MENMRERAIVVGLNCNHQEDFEHSMEELIELAKACEMEVVARVDQNLSSVVQALYIGAGKVQEVKELVESLEAEIVVFDDALSPMQIRNLQRELEVPILDRTSLILEIFSKRAKTREAKLQVEVARLQYLLPRLVGLHASLGRQGGGSGLHNKGTGEKKIDLDRKRIQMRIHELEKELSHIEKERLNQRKKRKESGIKRVALVGYTNVGKSTIMNLLIDQDEKNDTRKVFVKDMLFATLDTTVRKARTRSNREFLISDTVGFVSKLPHNLVKAFHATLEEVQEADLLLHVADYSQDEVMEQVKITSDTLKMLQAEHIPTIYVYNKAESKMFHLPRIKGNEIHMSAKEKIGIEQLRDLIETILYGEEEEHELLIPYDKGSIISYLNDQATILSTEYGEDGVHMKIICSSMVAGKLKEYLR